MRPGIVVGAAILALLLPAIPAIADPPTAVGVGASAPGVARAERPAERIDNLRLQRIPKGSMRGRLVVAGSLDHLPYEGVVHEVVIRMTMTVPRGDGRLRTVGRKVMDYRLPAGVSPQNMTLRWLLSKRDSRLVDRAGDAARVSVVVRESRADGPMTRHFKVADRLRVEPLTVPPTIGSSPKSEASTVFIPAGVYRVQQPQGSYWLYTSENTSGAPYVGETGLEGSDDASTWTFSPFQGPDKAPDDGSLYLVGGVPTWSFSVTEYVNFGFPTMSVSGSFGNGGALAQMAWIGIPEGYPCPSNLPSCTSGFPVGDGSVSGMAPSWE